MALEGRVFYGLLWFFFFQAEDGIRDSSVTGVQTCALPDLPRGARAAGSRDTRVPRDPAARAPRGRCARNAVAAPRQIGRASGRGRGEIPGVAGSLKKKKSRCGRAP